MVDGVDGTVARMAKVTERLPRFSGERLDIVVDYITYVFVPALALLKSGILNGTLGVCLASLILLSSLFHFSDEESKDGDYNFIGFPAIWNIVAFYLFALAPPATVAAAIVFALSILSFIPWRWPHPVRVVRMRTATLAMTTLFAVSAIATLVSGFPAEGATRWALLATALYGGSLPVIWQFVTKR